MNKITLDQLKEHNACVQQLYLFKELFGNEVEVTVEKCLEYYNKFDWAWVAACLLSNELCREYSKIAHPAREEYIKIERLAREKYEKIIQPTLEEYEKTEKLVPVWEEFLKFAHPAYKEYLEIIQPAGEEYLKKIAQAFGECYLKMGEMK